MKNKWIVVFLPLMLLACGSSVRSFIFPPEQERALGEAYNRMLHEGDSNGQHKVKFFVPKTKADSAMVRYIEDLNYRLVDAIPEDLWKSVKPASWKGTRHDFFTVQIIDSNIVNAFALPGGFTYLYTGILKRMRDEAELVGVMGHEIAHILMHHGRNRMIQQGAAQTILSLLLGDAGDMTKAAAMFGAQILFLKHGQGDELESDSIGIHLAARIQRNPNGIMTFFGSDIIKEDDSCDDRGALVSALEWFSSHPPNCARVAQARRIVANRLTSEEAQYLDIKYRYEEVYRQTIESALPTGN
jgi:predicted Zn-dependent protease